MLKYIPTLLLVIAIGAGAFVYREPVRIAMTQIYSRTVPCASPVTYRIGSVDERFKMTESEVLASLRKAEAIWETGAARELFAHDHEKGTVVINFVYDYRQEAIDTLKPIGMSIEKSQSSYDRLKAEYDRLKSGLEPKKEAVDRQASEFSLMQDEYNAEVQKWNCRGGAPPNVYEELQRQKNDLIAASNAIESAQNAVNRDIDVINALATTLNRLAHDMNIRAAEYNEIGRSTGGEFEEGVYESSLGEEKITIFEFGDRNELERVLAHELGHGLGLEHVEDANAIMYRLNQSSNDRLTPADLAEVERVCGAIDSA